jgi:phage antirepressor YoqD-like protein
MKKTQTATALTTFNTNATLTMSSREIAELTRKEHKNVLADIRKMLEGLGMTSAEFSAHMEVPMPRGGYRTEAVFNLPKDLTITLVSGYNVQMRYAITKRWMELEAQVAQQAPKLPTTFAEALRLAAELEEQREQLAQENAVLLPKAEAYTDLVDDKGYFNSTEVAAMFGFDSARKLNTYLKETLGWKHKGAEDLPNKVSLDNGWLVVKVRRSRHTHQAVSQCMFTIKGVDALRSILSGNEEAA